MMEMEGSYGRVVVDEFLGPPTAILPLSLP